MYYQVALATLDAHVFGAPARLDILQRVVAYQRAQLWQGTSKTLTRGEVRGGGRKPRPQKGSGRSRQGSIRSPLWVGGGVAHGPVPRDHRIKLPKKIRRFGLRVALSVKYGQGDLLLVDGLDAVAPKTKLFQAALDYHGITNALVVTGPNVPEGLLRAAGNIPNITIMPVTSAGLSPCSFLLCSSRDAPPSPRVPPLNRAVLFAGLGVMAMLKHHTLVLTVDAARALEKLMAPPPKATMVNRPQN
jgi:large subunit ribosomal protein L4